MKSEVLNKEIESTITHVRLTIKKDWDDQIADEYSVTIAGHEIPYFCGIGHRKMNVGYKNRTEKNCLSAKYKDKDLQIQHIKYATTPKIPTIDDVIFSLVIYSAAAEMTFDDWCADYGYDTDSRKALQTFLDCQKMANVLMGAGIDIAQAREAFQDY